MDSYDEAPQRLHPRSTFRVLGSLALVFLVAMFLLVSCIKLYVGSTPKPSIEIARAELAFDVPKFYPVPDFGAYGTQTHGVWVTLHRDGTATAFLSKDPVSGCFVSWGDQLAQFNNIYRDACSGATYSPAGVSLVGQSLRGLDGYDTDVNDTTVTVELTRPNPAPQRAASLTSTPPAH